MSDDVGEYMGKLIDRGWQGDEYMISKVFVPFTA